MVKSRRVIWVLAISLLLVPTLWIVFVARLAPPTYVATSKMMMPGTLSLAPPPTPASLNSLIDRDTVYAILALVIVYTPGLALLLFAIFYRRRPREIVPPTI